MSSTEGLIKKAYTRIAAYCAKAERSPRQIDDKLKNYQLSDDEKSALLTRLKSENYFDESRFAKSFANDKLKFNKWGKIRISRELYAHGVEEESIAAALEYIDEEIYFDILRKVISTKWKQTSLVKEHALRKNKVIQYALQKGFSYDDVKSSFEKSFR